MAFDYTNLYPDTSSNGAFTKSWNYTSVVDNVAACSASGFFNKVATRLGIGDNIIVAQVDAFDKTRTTLLDHGSLFVTGIAAGVVTTALDAGGGGGDVTKAYVDAADALRATITYVDAADALKADITYVDAADAAVASAASSALSTGLANKVVGPSSVTDDLPVIFDGTTGKLVKSKTYSAFKTLLALVKGDVGLGNVDNTADTAKPVSTAQQTALDLKANLASPTFTGVPAGPTATLGTGTTQLATTAFVSAAVSAGGTFIDAPSDGSSYGRLNAAWAAVAPLASPAITGTPTAPTATVGTNTTQLATTAFVLANAAGAVSPATVAPLVDGTAAVGTSLLYARQDHVHPTDTTRAPLASPAFTGTPTGITKAHVGLGSVDNTADTAKPVSTAQQTALDLKAPLASPAFTGTPTGITKTHVGLGNVDNTADTAKPVSTAQQTALNLKAPLASPTFTGTVNATAVNLGTDGGFVTIGPGGTGAVSARIKMIGANAAGQGSLQSFSKNDVAGTIWFFGHASAAEGSGTSNDLEYYNATTTVRTIRLNVLDDSVSFNSTVSGTSTGAAAVTAKSLGLSENIVIGGNSTIGGSSSVIANQTIGGKFSTTKGSKALVNGVNSDIAFGAFSSVRLTGPTAAFTVGGFTAGVDGQRLTIYNTVAFAMTIGNQNASSSGPNRIITLTGADVVLRAGLSSATFAYDIFDARWILEAYN